MHEALDDPKVTKVVAMKSAQVAWTDGVLLNYIGRRIDIDPCPMIVMFAKDLAASQFDSEKLTPMIEVTPPLLAKVPVHRSRSKDNKQDFKSFPGGFLKLVGSNSPSSVKSTPAPVVAVEEPDDCNDNVREQGDTITLLEERTKTFPRRKVIFGGTPTIEGVSRVEAAYKASDQRKFFVPCHECGESHVLAWENVRWLQDASEPHEVFGRSRPETAAYACPHCGALWSDVEKNRNVKRGQWRATVAFHGTAGFYINELYSPFPGSTLARLVEKHLAAEHANDLGDDTKLRAFTNNTLGLAYAYRTELPDAAVLAERAEDYEEGTIPEGGLVLSAGADVQHDRIAVIVRAWGRGEESWLVLWIEIPGQTVVPFQGAWIGLEQVLFERTYRHACGAPMRIQGTTLDTSDGQTSDAAYAFVRKWAARGVIAGKGRSDTTGEREIYSPPRQSSDTDRKMKAWKYGLRPFMIGTQRAKDLLLGHDANGGRLKLQGEGPGRLHWYRGVRPDYWTGLLSEVKAPSKTVRNRKVWVKKAGVRNEPLDCEVYALHQARHLKVHLLKDEHWRLIEQRLRQVDLLSEQTAAPVAEPTIAAPAPAPPAAPLAPALVPAARGRRVLSKGVR